MHGHFYSVPYRLVREVIEARVTDQTIELFHRGDRFACHLRNPRQHRHTTIAAHMPSAHCRHAEWTPTGLLREAEAVGPATIALVERILATKPHPEQGFRACLGTLRLVRSDGPEQLEAACQRGMDIMLTRPTTDCLRELGLAGMARALEEQRRHAVAADLGFEDRLAMLVERDGKRLAARLWFAGLRQQATPEDVDHRAARGLDRALFQKLTGGEWIERHQDLLVTGPTGTGKTWLSCALGHRACRDDRSVLYQRVPRLLEALGIARGDGRYARMLKNLARVQLLILDDWATTPLTAEQRRDLMEIVDDRHDRASTIVTSQVPVELWHEHIGNPTIADGVLDRLVHGAHRLELKGESMRTLRAAKVRLDEAAVQ